MCTLFILFFNVVIGYWYNYCKEIVVKLLYKCGGKLVGERIKVTLESWLTEFFFCKDGP